MRRTKRWLVIFAALVGLMAHAGALRATSLIFGKVPTSTTTTTSTQTPTETEAETAPPSLVAEHNSSTERTLTGIPQIDYIWDPNLPRELNGYNLSDYPFYSTVPPNEEIDFKCDGLHDGFYAAVKHKCQLYHHCIAGVRHDFLCANFTAFDQRTFICHFVSEVDCKNSQKYFFRNDALYIPLSTTTTTTTTTTVAPILPPSGPGMRPRPGHPRRRPPLRRRRPQVDYYYDDDDYDDEYYEERRNRRRKQRPRNRRPDYDDDYEERRGYSDDDRYEKRPYNRDRMREDSDDYDIDRRKVDRPRNRNKSSGENRRSNEEDRLDRHKNLERRRESEDRRLPAEERRSGNSDHRHSIDERRSFNEDRLYKKDRNKSPDYNDEESELRPTNGRKRHNGDRRPIYDDTDDDVPPRRRDEDRPLRRDKEEEEDVKTTKDEDKALVKPSGSSGLSSLFGPRVPPKIARPVPLTERKKFEYVTKKTTTPAPVGDEEYYDEYEDEPPLKKSTVREENLEKSDSSAPRRPIAPPAKQDQRTRYETDRDSEQKEPEKSSANSSLFNHREASRRPFFASRGKDNSRNRHDNNRDNDEKIEEQTDATSNYNKRDQTKRIPNTSKREDSKHLFEEDNTSHHNRDDHLEKAAQKSKYKPLTRHGYRGPAKKDNSAEEEEEEEPQYRERSQNSPKVISNIRIGTEKDSSVENKRIDNNRHKEVHRNEPREEDQSIKAELKHSEELEKPSSEEDSVREIRPIVRVVKRPFLPSRGGSPYLPRGLQPVGAAQKSHTTESTPVDMGSTVSGVRLLEHAAPIVRSSVTDNDDDDYPQLHQGPRTTQQPQIDPPKTSLEEIYDNEYDVTLNDALNPTLKPLSPNRGYPSGFSHSNKFENNRFSSPAGAGFSQNGDSYYSSSDVRSSAVRAPNDSRQHSSSSKRSHEYYDDEYDY